MAVMKKISLLSTLFLSLFVAQISSAQTIAQWTIENAANTNGLNFAPGAGNSPGTILADNGLLSASSVASGLHTNAATYSAPAGDLDPTIAGLFAGASGPGLPGSGAANASPSFRSFSANNWSVGDYWSFSTSTLGATGVSVAFDQAGSGTGPANFGLSYSINGGGFNAFASYSILQSTWNTTTAAPSSLLFAGGGVFDNANSIVFRLTDLTTTAINAGTVGTGGTDRVDNFTVVSVVPEPTTLALVGLASLGLIMRRRK